MAGSMAGFTYRDLREPLVSEALAALPAGLVDDGVRGRLQREQEALASGGWTVEDRTMLAVAADWLWNAVGRPEELIASDPVLVANGRAPLLTEARAAAIAMLPTGSGRAPENHLEQVRVAIDDDATLTELVQAAWSAWLQHDGAYPYDDVAVVLPLRIETLFDAPGSEANPHPSQWQLSVRVVPDEASIRRDDAHVSDGELAAVRAFWSAVRRPGAFDPSWLADDHAEVAWAALSTQVSPARAAWLVSTLVPEVAGDQLVVEPPADMPSEPQPNRVGGLPERLAVSVTTREGTGESAPQPVGSLPMSGSSIRVEALTLPLPDTTQNTRAAWWSSWSTAVEVGLGGQWLLDPGLDPESLAALYVTGVGDEPPEEHFRGQVEAGELGVLRLGAPTNTVHGAPAADLATDADAWRAVARARLDPSGETTVGSIIEQHLVGTADSLPFFPGGDAHDDTRDSILMAQALWPALLGHWLVDDWEVDSDAFRANQWAFPPPSSWIPGPDEIRKVLLRDLEDPAIELGGATFCPEGPLMPVRIGDQPYGLLPVTALSAWESDERTPGVQARVEEAAAAALTALRRDWADAARRNGTVVGADTDRFMELLSRDALSQRYVERSFLPASAWAAPYQLDPEGWDRFREAVRDLHRRVIDLVGTEPADLPLANGFWRPSDLPLVQPSRTFHRQVEQEVLGPFPLTSFLARQLDPGGARDLGDLFADWWLFDGAETQIRTLPDSLLIRLLVHACQVGSDWLEAQTGSDLGLQAIKGQVEAVRALSRELDQKDWNQAIEDPGTSAVRFVTTIPDARRAQLERAFRATLDSAAHRIDPWVTGFAWQRLRTTSSSDRRRHRLGAYGWVDGPFPGEPGPTAAGRLHTPSYAQTLAAIVLRDKYLSSERAGSTNDRGDNPWDLAISSRPVRLAEELAEEVRLGFHIYEIVGRHVEDVVGDHQQVKALRTHASYAMRAERADPHEVCNGMAALRGLLRGDPDFLLTGDQRTALQTLDDALDCYGDLLMADGVMQLVNRQPDRAAETMDAAAGFARPPSFEFVSTPPSGYQLENLVLTTLPYVAIDEIALDAGPVQLADPSLAAFVEETVTGPWTWSVINRDDGTELTVVTLDQLGLRPIDTVTLSDELLEELVRHRLGIAVIHIAEEHNREWVVKDPAGAVLGVVTSVELPFMPSALPGFGEAAVLRMVREAAGAPPDSPVEESVPADPRVWVATDDHGNQQSWADLEMLGLSAEEASALERAELHRRVRLMLGLPDAMVVPPAEHARAQQLAAGLGSRPAAGRDLVRDPEVQKRLDAAVYQELVDRYTALHVAGRRLVSDLRAGDAGQRPILLRRAMTWAITPLAERADRDALFAVLSANPLPEGATPVADLAAAMAQLLEDRLDAAPQPTDLPAVADLGAPLADHEQRKREQLPDGVASLAEAIANLASPEGKLSVTACWPRADLVQVTSLVAEEGDAGLDETWLTVVAAVRPALARLEALQLGLETAMDAWSSSPGDPFLTAKDALVHQNLETRSTGSVNQMSLDARFVAAYGRHAAWAGEHVAVGLVDSYSEAVPMPQRSTSTAFGFNAPAARAPQAILLAVPSRPEWRLEEDLLLQTIVETRELVHARAARVEDLGDLQSLAPTTWLQTSGPARVRLEPYPLFT